MGPTESRPSSILIVEDESVVAMDLEANLKKLGYLVLGSASSGEEALDSLHECTPDLILMDIQLNGTMNGLAVAELVHRQYSIPVVFLTANVSDETIARAKSKSYGFLNKPFRPKELNATIEIALYQHRAGQQLFAERGWLRTMLDSISDGVVGTDANGIVRYLNPAGAELTGWTVSDAAGNAVEQVFAVSHLTGEPVEQSQPLQALRDAKAIVKERFLLRTHAGTDRPIEGASAAIIEEGQARGVVTVFLDISDRLQGEKRIQEERQKLVDEVEMTSQALGQTREELQALSHHLITAQEQERRRIARELHDDLGQQAAFLGMQIDQLKAQFPFHNTDLASIRSGLDKLNQGLREVSHQLHPSILEDLGLSEALDYLVSNFHDQGLEVQSFFANREKLPINVSTALYRIAQESLRNVLKHAAASSVRVVLKATRSEVNLRISDDGQGFSLGDVRRRGGLGLVSMQERARLVGGNLLLTAEPDKGTTVLVRIPL